METNGISTALVGKEIQCPDCGNVYAISRSQQSSRCDHCGNISFHADHAEPLRDLISANGLSPRQEAPSHSPKVELTGLEFFRQTPDGLVVQDILARYQVEWQLWDKVVKNFSDPAYHMAYLSHILMMGTFDLAIERYKEHRTVMVLAAETKWQAEISDLMLERVQNLAAVRMKMTSPRPLIPPCLFLLPFDSRVIKFGWVVLGMVLLSRIFL